jgi:hypothetical protein
VSLTPVANSEPFALRVAATATISSVIAITDTRIHLPSLSRPGPIAPPINLVTLGARARILPRKDTATAKPPVPVMILLSLLEVSHD